MKYDAIFFDLDGTIVDSLQDIANAVNHTMRHFGLTEHTPESLRPKLGYGIGTLMKRILPPDMTDAEREEIIAFYKPYYAAHTCDVGRPFEGILPMMARLKALGMPMAILSNKPDIALQPIARAFFADLASLSMGERDGVRRKPHPEMLEDAAARLGVRLDRCLYVGDSEVDIDTAKNAGMDCVCVTWGFRSREDLIRAGATVIVDTPEALLELAAQSD